MRVQVGLLWFDIQSNTKKTKRIWHQWFIWKGALHNWDSFGVFQTFHRGVWHSQDAFGPHHLHVMPSFSYKYRPGGHVVLTQVISSSKSLLLSTSISLISRFQSIHHHVDLRQLRLRWPEPVQVIVLQSQVPNFCSAFSLFWSLNLVLYVYFLVFSCGREDSVTVRKVVVSFFMQLTRILSTDFLL